MSQPVWKLVYATDYSVLYVDTTGAYDPELAIAQTDDDAGLTYVYRFPLERCYQATNDDGTTFLCSMDPARTDLPYPLAIYVPWFAKSLGKVAESVGSTAGDLVSALCSEDPGTRAEAYEAIGGYHGYRNFDSDPEEWTEHEFAEWPDRGAKLDDDERDAFTTGYISCALWCGVLAYKHEDACPCAGTLSAANCACANDPELVSSGESYDESDLTDDARERLTTDAHAFYADNVVDLRACDLTMDRAGHDFYLTRNRHGAGFWDEGNRKLPGANEALDRLTKASHAYGSEDLYLATSDGKVGVM